MRLGTRSTAAGFPGGWVVILSLLAIVFFVTVGALRGPDKAPAPDNVLQPKLVRALRTQRRCSRGPVAPGPPRRSRRPTRRGRHVVPDRHPEPSRPAGTGKGVRQGHALTPASPRPSAVRFERPTSWRRCDAYPFSPGVDPAATALPPSAPAAPSPRNVRIRAGTRAASAGRRRGSRGNGRAWRSPRWCSASSASSSASPSCCRSWRWVFGFVSLRRIKRSGGTISGRGMALAGVWLGVLGVLVGSWFRIAGATGAFDDDGTLAPSDARVGQCVNSRRAHLRRLPRRR